MKQKKAFHFLLVLFAAVGFVLSGGCTLKASPGNTDGKDDPVPPIADLTGWLYTENNKIYTSDGQVWAGRGVNIHDTRQNWEAVEFAPNVDLVKAQIDEAVDVWGANFLRLCMETDPSVTSWGGIQYQGVLDDPEYLEDIIEIVDYIGTKNNVYVLLSLWTEPTTNSEGWPTAQTTPVWECLAEAFKDRPQVIFGIINEPEGQEESANVGDLWAMYNTIVNAIRAVENSGGTPHHLISVQGTYGWARYLDYYLANRITAGGGDNIVYETHAYVSTADFDTVVKVPSQNLPVIIGEFGPANMSLNDCGNLLEIAQEEQIPIAAWSFHGTAEPCLLEYYGKPESISADGPLTPTPIWGNFMLNALASDPGSPLVRTVAMDPVCIVNNASTNFTITAEIEDLEGSVTSVYADLSPIGGDAHAVMSGSGGNTYSASYTVPAGFDVGEVLLTITATDNQGNKKYRSNNIEVIQPADSDLVIYADGEFLNTWSWNITEDTSHYYEGNESLTVSQQTAGWWAGFNWGLSYSGINVAGYSSLDLYYHMTGSRTDTEFKITISDLAGNEQEISLGYPNTGFEYVSIPVSSLNININEIATLMFFMTNSNSFTGTLWVDDIRFVP